MDSHSRSDLELAKVFDCSRICGGAEQTFLILLYSPIGVILSVLRLFMLFHIYIISCVLPLNLAICRGILKMMLALCGLVVRVKDEHHRRDSCPVIICNYISPVDRLTLSLIQPNIMANEWGLPAFLSWLFGLRNLHGENSREAFLQNARGLCEETSMPLFTRPEGLPTSGKYALLKFSSWPFSISDSVQPVVLQASRPMSIAMTTIRSNVLSDIFWFIFTPYTVFTVRYLPVEMRGEQTAEDFSEVVREGMAATLGVCCSRYSRHDSRELVKRIIREGKSCEVSQSSARNAGQQLAPNLEAMVQHCKEVVPQVPLTVLRAEILRTEDSEATLSNIFEGNLQYEPETQPLTQSVSDSGGPKTHTRATHDIDVTRSSGSQTYAAKVFAKQSNQREMSLSERKHAMLTEARLRYIKKHQLPITLQDIKSS
ncbi:lipid droplet-regulating VLDL assembly factor AUP1-like [Watersipora subatra]|uniref:lipid droplet-regulating VLDL assembly factor AUP1-like n=1 Tax=Watersipora subatra TaxID=2589382 RepID=UPI00355C93C6